MSTIGIGLIVVPTLALAALMAAVLIVVGLGPANKTGEGRIIEFLLSLYSETLIKL